jgi:UDP-N-acetylglucosamine:LPS N-acetylglucosamine transferase
LAEAAAVGRPCVVLPRRDVASDHQRKNAHALSARGAIALTTRAGLADDVLTVLADERRHATLAANLARWQRATTSPAAALLALALSPALAAPRAAAE